MKLLFVHQNFPGQFPHIAGHFADQSDNRVVAVGEAENLKKARRLHPRIELVGYRTPERSAHATHRFVQPYDAAVRRGLVVAETLGELKRNGFIPDVVVAHPGWGEALFIRDVFPESRIVQYAEFFYRPSGADVGFDPEFPTKGEDAFRLRVKNTTQVISMDQADLLIAPTQWQQQQFSLSLQKQMQVVHDGIDTSVACPNPLTRIRLARAGIELGLGDEVVTYVARNLEPYRGFHIFMRALPPLLAARPRARVLIVGGDTVSYGSLPGSAKTWREAMLAEVGSQLDLSRVHFLGRLPYAGYLNVLQVSSVHIYLTYPFVLSWSMLEAMSAGCVLLASRTAPVEEVIHDNANGLLVNFFDHRELADRAAQALADQAALADIRFAARQTILDRYDLRSRCLPRQVDLIRLMGD